MPHYKLVPSGRSDSQVDEIVLSRDEHGEVEHSLSVHEPREIPEEHVAAARALAGNIGVEVAEVEAPADSEEEQPVGEDTEGGSGQAVSQGSSSFSGSGTTPTNI